MVKLAALGLSVLVAAAACGSSIRTAQRPSPTTSPPPAFADFQVVTGALACAGSGTAEDIYYPRWTGAAAPAVVFIHGGAWTSGSRTDVRQTEPLPTVLRQRGYAVVSIDYRLAPGSRWPAMFDDARCALDSLRADAAGLGIDAQRIAVMGVSAGAQLALLLGFELPQSERPAAVIDVSGPVDLTSPEFGYGKSAIGQQVFGAASSSDPVLRSASPVTYVAPGDPPVLILHGTADQLVPYDQALELQSALQKVNDKVQLVAIPNGTHDLAGALGAESALLSFLQANV
ncbi:MAG TPA: alpha/beta hydrolase [Candidatus Dormibacteraeota bacterium]